MMEEALRTLLVADPTLGALVAPGSIVWNHLPQATPRPAIVLFRISGAPGVTMQGSDGLINGTVQIDVQAHSVTEMWAIRDALSGLLHGHRDATLTGIFFLSERQSAEPLGDNLLIHRCSMDFDVWARAAA
jgi:hypothetical protein